MRKPTATILFFALLFGVSSESHAFLEWLHKLSGPGHFVGLKLTGRFHCGRGEGCRLLEIGTPGVVDKLPRWTGTLGFGANWSYQNNLEYPIGVDAPRVWIWSLEPSIERWFTSDRDLFLAAGWAFNEFQGRRFEDFRRDAVVVRMGHRWYRPKKTIHAWELGARYLYFEDGFRPSEFGAIGEEEEERGILGAFVRIFFWKKSVGEP